MAVKIKGVSVGSGSSPKIMGVLNISPESFFSDSFTPCDMVLTRVEEMLREGADVIDVGARSTALSAPPLSVPQERERVVTALQELEGYGAVLSLDTMHAEVLDAALRYDIAAINDIRGLGNPVYANLAADSGLPVIAMAARDRHGDPVDLAGTLDALEIVCERAAAVGISDLILDPGVGKWTEERPLAADWELCRSFSLMREFGFPLLAAVSRKTFIGDVLGKPAHERLFGTLGLLFYLLWHGADLIRVHDVGASRDIVRVFEQLMMR